MGLVLFIVAIILLGLLCLTSWIFTICYYVFSFNWVDGFFNLNDHFRRMAISIDKFGNIACGTQLRLMFIKRKSTNVHQFGDGTETVSYVLAINEKRENLSFTGKLMVDILEALDSGHMEKSINAHRLNDELAKQRFETNSYF